MMKDIFAGIHLADDCLGDKLNIQQFTQTWQKTSSEGFDFGCLKGLQKYIQSNKIHCLSALNLFPKIPMYHFDANALKMAYSVLDDIIDRKPSLKCKALDVIELISQSPNNDESSRIKANHLLYHIGQKYPETIKRIEEFTGKNLEQLAPKNCKLPDFEFIYMGKEKPSAEKFKEIYTEDGLGLKFRGGLWTSPKTANGHSEWYNWDKFEGFSEDLDKQTAYYIEPTKDSRCLVVDSLQDLEPYMLRNEYFATLDVKALKKDYDCVYVEDPRDGKFNLCLNGWDVSTLVMLKADKFKAFTAEEWERHKQVSQKIRHNTNNDRYTAKNNISPDDAYIRGFISLQEYRQRY